MLSIGYLSKLRPITRPRIVGDVAQVTVPVPTAAQAATLSTTEMLHDSLSQVPSQGHSLLPRRLLEQSVDLYASL